MQQSDPKSKDVRFKNIKDVFLIVVLLALTIPFWSCECFSQNTTSRNELECHVVLLNIYGFQKSVQQLDYAAIVYTKNDTLYFIQDGDIQLCYLYVDSMAEIMNANENWGMVLAYKGKAYTFSFPQYVLYKYSNYWSITIKKAVLWKRKDPTNTIIVMTVGNVTMISDPTK